MESLKTLESLSAEFKAQRQQFQKRGVEVLKAALGDLFTCYPELGAVRWRQYTPYFNDGDECVFGVHEVEFLKAGQEESDDGEWTYLWSNDKGGLSDAAHASLLTLNQQIQDMEEVLHAAFGDHVQVIVKKDGVTVEEYSHD